MQTYFTSLALQEMYPSNVFYSAISATLDLFSPYFLKIRVFLHAFNIKTLTIPVSIIYTKVFYKNKTLLKTANCAW